jgi:hypothetical protein
VFFVQECSTNMLTGQNIHPVNEDNYCTQLAPESLANAAKLSNAGNG